LKYEFENKELFQHPKEYNKNSDKELLQYAVGALLYMPASNTKIADKIINKEYKNMNSIVLDLEDSLGDDMQSFGKINICNIAEKLKTEIKEKRMTYNDLPLIFIRVREQGQMQEMERILGENVDIFTGFNIPKFDSTNCNAYINEFKKIAENAHKKYNCNLYLIPIIENKLALYRQLRMDNLLKINNALRPITNNVLNIRVGGTDFCGVFGIRRGPDESIHDIGVIRSVLADIVNVFGKNYVIAGPVWEYFGNDTNSIWAKGLKEELKKDKLNGFIGKTSVHPNQLPIIQESLIVKHHDFMDAISILGMNENVTGVKKSTDDGFGNHRMNEVKTHKNWANKIINLAHIYGVEKGEF